MTAQRHHIYLHLLGELAQKYLSAKTYTRLQTKTNYKTKQAKVPNTMEAETNLRPRH